MPYFRGKAVLMSSIVLVASLGNRNLTYRGNYIETFVRQYHAKEYMLSLPGNRQVVNFREFTQWLWQNYHAEKPHLKLEIIDKAIEHHRETLQHLILFTTDQTDPKNKHQDTFYEGYLVKQLVQEQHGLPTQLIPFSGNPTDEDQLIESISPQLQLLTKDHSEKGFVYHDAGGTPQMKAVIKELLDYYLPSERFQVSYSNQHAELTDKKRSFQKKYQSLTLARAFVLQYQYGAAHTTLKHAHQFRKVSKELREYVRLANFRINLRVDQTKIIKHRFSSIIAQQYREGKTPENAIPFRDYKPQDRFEIFEIASICQLYFQQKNYPFAIATLYRLLEQICLIIVRKKYNIDTPWLREKFVKQELGVVKAKFPGLNREIYGLPIMLGYTYLRSSPQLQQLLDVIIPNVSHINQEETGINMLRNKAFLAHGTEIVDRAMIQQQCPNLLESDLPQFFQLLGMPERNIYDQMNDEMLTLFNQE